MRLTTLHQPLPQQALLEGASVVARRTLEYAFVWSAAPGARLQTHTACGQGLGACGQFAHLTHGGACAGPQLPGCRMLSGTAAWRPRGIQLWHVQLNTYSGMSSRSRQAPPARTRTVWLATRCGAEPRPTPATAWHGDGADVLLCLSRAGVAQSFSPYPTQAAATSSPFPTTIPSSPTPSPTLT